ncbi:FAD-dependent oxidoreductase [Mycobacterium sp. Aquia_216]|uniref:FAD-dependent oxidoreductase n=1 Tax=Mycobacterium sp. Aquia_216 TaxID=2991729 RepID=UPI00227CE928|nr:FAD-dependent oxidoreductase [Mycobacterium sp. Aquia_216]WAJ43435.1 FAD-dependent oxidoreductase [Mycobacterium sp. Aquia_216]
MTFVITQNCCKDASCVPVCPVDCIRPAGGAGESTDTEMLYIDPATCIDCGACAEECPVDAIYYEEDLPAKLERFRDINARYFEHAPLTMDLPSRDGGHAAVGHGSLRVAIVGAGPSGCYAANALARVGGVEIALFERLPTPFGLVRAGVAPDHQHTKAVVEVFDPALTSRTLRCHLNVAIGQDLTHEELLEHHHAVIYAVGASLSREIGITGEHLPGSHAAADFVGWYNGHPDHAHHVFDLSAERAVIIGNGNVALDVARVLLTGPEELRQTDIAEHALDSLANSMIREVQIIARRGPREAAFSVGEFLALGHLPGVDIVIDGDGLESLPDDDVETAMKLEIAREFAHRPRQPENKRIIFRFRTSPLEVAGDDHARGLHVRHPGGETETIPARLILRSVGYRGAPIDGLAFDSGNGVVPNDNGRVLNDDGLPVPGVYVTGWIKRGSRGVIGTNRSCAEESVTKLWEDFDAGLLNREIGDQAALDSLLAKRVCDPVDWQGWCAIDAAERQRGQHADRPRVKFVDLADMLSAATVRTVSST